MILDSKTFVFIIGSTRSGTTWLHRMLAEHAAIATRREELSWFSNYVAPVMKSFASETGIEAHLNHGLPILVGRDEFIAGLREATARVYERVLSDSPNATHILDKRPEYGRHMQTIEHIIPHAKYIHIIRDGRDVTASMFSVRKKVGGFTDAVDTAAWEWKTSVTAARNSGSAIGPLRYLEVRYEKLVSDTAKELERIFEFLGLPLDEAEIARIANEHHSSKKLESKGDAAVNALRGIPDAIWSSQFDLQDRYIFQRTAGPLLIDLGYAGPDWWAPTFLARARIALWEIGRKGRNSMRALGRIWGEPITKRN